MDLTYHFAIARQGQLIADAEQRRARPSTGRPVPRLRALVARLAPPEPEPIATPCVTC